MSDVKRGRGRPVLPDRERKKNYVSFMLTDQEKRAVEKAAKREGKARSAWIRDLILAALKKSVRKTKKTG